MLFMISFRGGVEVIQVLRNDKSSAEIIE